MKLSLHEILKAERELAASRPAPKTEWERILVPIDFSENSREAITLLHVVEPEHPFQRGNEVMMTLSKGDAEIRYEAERRLERWAAQEAGPDIEIATVVRFGKVTDEILALAETRDCDIIVLATEPAVWMKRLFSGSVTAQLQRRAKCAVINIRPATPLTRQVIPAQFPTEKVVRFKQPARRAIPVR
jgi:nucleotide-binding universal stress UspA family protein